MDSATPTTPSPDPALAIPQLAAALRRGDPAAAARVFEPPAAAPDPAAVRTLAEGMMRSRRWADAAWLFDRLPARDTADEMKRRMSRNLAALQIHRPAVYDLLVGLPAQDRFGIAPAASGQLTILARTADGSAVCLSPGRDPLGTVAETLPQLRQRTPRGEALALCGIGDGYLLMALAAHPPQLFLSTEQAVFLLEPEAQLLLLCLMIHDYTGPAGPIEQDRVRWFVGRDWATRLAEAVDRDPMLGVPSVMLLQGLEGPAIQAQVQSLTADVIEQDRRLDAAVRGNAQALRPADLAELFGPNPPRRPRVLLVTTRFSTVLQYSTRDAAAGFEQAGWDAQVAIEPTPSHRLYRPALRRLLAEFNPDLVFQIDHLRHEHDGLFPPELPFACWIQDHLAHLLSTDAGRQVGPLDFVLTDAAQTFVTTYGYPPSQMVALPKLTAVPSSGAGADTTDAIPSDDEQRATQAPPLRGAGPRACGPAEDLVYVSNASGTPDALLDGVRDHFFDSPAEQILASAAARRLVGVYEAVGTVDTFPGVCDVLREVQSVFGVELDATSFHQVARRLYHPLNDALYRQQAVRWVVRVAREQGLRVGLYGAGWERHPEFAPYARGPVAYGEALADLTRRSAINLQIVPFLCLHQRLLDGLTAGGFFLVRPHKADVAPQAMSDLLHEHFEPSVRTLRAARTAAPPPVRGRFESLVTRCREVLCFTQSEDEDPVSIVRDWEEAQLLVPGRRGVLPRLEETTFRDQNELADRVRRFVADPVLRAQIAAEQRQSVAGRLGYAAGMRRVARTIGRMIGDRSAAPAGAARGTVIGAGGTTISPPPRPGALAA